MAVKVASFRSVGRAPQEIVQMRKASIQAHKTYGMPVILKHKWNWQDVKDGRAQECPFHGDDEGDRYDEYCFGTGILGGWADGIITYITIADTQEDVFRLNDQGVLIHQATPGFTAPWTPEMGDGDLLITGDFDSEWNLVYPRTRYVLEEVTPVTIRGFQDRVQTREFVVHQSGNMDKLPPNHDFYDVPIVFDYGNIPDHPVVPPGGDPDDYNYPTGIVSQSARQARIIGRGGFVAGEDRTTRITGLGNTGIDSRAARITGKGSIFVHI